MIVPQVSFSNIYYLLKDNLYIYKDKELVNYNSITIKFSKSSIIPCNNTKKIYVTFLYPLSNDLIKSARIVFCIESSKDWGLFCDRNTEMALRETKEALCKYRWVLNQPKITRNIEEC